MHKSDAHLCRLPQSNWRNIKDGVHRLQASFAKLVGRPGSGMITDLEVNGKPVIFIHNPKAGGTSLGKFLNVKRRSHAFPEDRLNEAAWIGSFIVVVVRNPVDRFLSGYYDHVLRRNYNGLVKRYGEDVWKLSLSGYLDLLKENSRYGGSQTNWTDYPSATKPRADLILRFEEIDAWKKILIEHRLGVFDRNMPVMNTSDNGQKDHLRRLGIDRATFDTAIDQVASFFKGDYDTFGYRRSDLFDKL